MIKIKRESFTELKRNQWTVNQLMVDGFKGKRFLPAPPGFMRSLKDFDPDLTLWFNRIINRWQLYWCGNKVKTFQTPEGGFQRVTSDLFDELRKADGRTRGEETVVEEIAKENEELIEADERSFRNKVGDVQKEVAEGLAKQSEAEVGAINFPKEDLRIPDEDELEKQRKSRRHVKNYRRRPMPYFDLANDL